MVSAYRLRCTVMRMALIASIACNIDGLMLKALPRSTSPRASTPVMQIAQFSSMLKGDIQRRPGLRDLLLARHVCDDDGLVDRLTVWTYSASDLFIHQIAPWVRNVTIIFGQAKPMTKKQVEWMHGSGMAYNSSGKRLDAYLRANLKKYNNSYIKGRIEEGTFNILLRAPLSTKSKGSHQKRYLVEGCVDRLVWRSSRLLISIHLPRWRMMLCCTRKKPVSQNLLRTWSASRRIRNLRSTFSLFRSSKSSGR
jgi:hypothetical protein